MSYSTFLNTLFGHPFVVKTSVRTIRRFALKHILLAGYPNANVHKILEIAKWQKF